MRLAFPWSSVWLGGTCLALVLSGCGDDGNGNPPASQPLVQEADALFPSGPAQAEAERLAGEVVTAADAGDDAAAEAAAYELTELTLTEYAAGRLVGAAGQLPGRLDDFLTNVFTAAGMTPPSLTPANLGPEGIVAVVRPAGGTFVSGSKRAGLQVPAGAVSRPTLLVAGRLPDSSQYAPREGPLPTPLAQYPLFYRFTLTPDLEFSADAIIGLCQVTEPASAFHAPDPVFQRLQLAHPKPGDPSTIELLTRVDAPFLECDGVTANAVRAGLLARRPGIGGRVRRFSPFAAADVSVEGAWTGTYTPNGSAVSFPISVNLEESGSSVTGSYALPGSPRFGSVTATRSGTDLLNWVMTQQSGCPGTWQGSASLSADARTMTVTYTGSDCLTGGPITGVATVTKLVATFTDPGIATTSLPAGAVGQAYNATLVGTGGNGTYTWSVVGGTLPNGLTLGANTGVLSGTPTALGSANFTVQVTSQGVTAQRALSIAVTSSGLPVTITTSSLPNGTVSQSYSQTLTATGGSGSYTWSVVAGTLPAGLTLAAGSGILAGTPAAPGVATFTVRATSGALAGERQFTVTIAAAAVTITTTSLPGGTVGASYSAFLQASGGAGIYQWSVLSGALPAGLTLNQNTGAISGTPTALGTANFTVRATSGGQSADRQLSIAIAAGGLRILTTAIEFTLPDTRFTPSIPGSQPLVAQGGTGTYTWSLVSGTLPVGATLAPASGVIAGNVSAPGSGAIRVRVSDGVTAVEGDVAVGYRCCFF